MATRTKHSAHAQGARGKKLSASSYFETLRTISSDPAVLSAAERAEKQITAKVRKK